MRGVSSGPGGRGGGVPGRAMGLALLSPNRAHPAWPGLWCPQGCPPNGQGPGLPVGSPLDQLDFGQAERGRAAETETLLTRQALTPTVSKPQQGVHVARPCVLPSCPQREGGGGGVVVLVG